MLGALLGSGGSGSPASSPILASIAETLAQKLGFPPAIVQGVLSFVLTKLIAALSSPASATRGPAQARRSLDMQGLLVRASQGQSLDKRMLNATGLPQELAQYAGLDPDTAVESLQHVLESLAAAGSASGNP